MQLHPHGSRGGERGTNRLLLVAFVPEGWTFCWRRDCCFCAAGASIEEGFDEPSERSGLAGNNALDQARSLSSGARSVREGGVAGGATGR